MSHFARSGHVHVPEYVIFMKLNKGPNNSYIKVITVYDKISVAKIEI